MELVQGSGPLQAAKKLAKPSAVDLEAVSAAGLPVAQVGGLPIPLSHPAALGGPAGTSSRAWTPDHKHSREHVAIGAHAAPAGPSNPVPATEVWSPAGLHL